MARDYGVAWDESSQRQIGLMSYSYITHQDKQLLSFIDRDYGPAFELLLVWAEKSLDLTDPRHVYLMRHTVTFIFFVGGLIFFYRLGLRMWRHSGWALLACLLLVLSPRIFADSFYNSKDIPSLVMAIISMYTLMNYAERKDIQRACWHALACALWIDIRLTGVLSVGLTIVLMWKERSCWLYLLLTAALTLLAWPFLWESPLINFLSAWLSMTRFQWPLTVLYQGQYFSAATLPWHYLPWWMTISTPLGFLTAGILGYVMTLKSLLVHPVAFYRQRRNELIVLGWLTIPIVAVILMRTVIYDGYRQLYFVYPALVILAVMGFRQLYQWIGKYAGDRLKQAAQQIFLAMMALYCLGLAGWMIRVHPYQHLYFNRLAGSSLAEIQQRYEMDYWGLSFTQVLRNLAANDPSDVIRIYVDQLPRRLNTAMLSTKDQARFVFVDDFHQASYLVTNFRWNKEGYPKATPYYAVKLDDAIIAAAYRLPSSR